MLLFAASKYSVNAMLFVPFQLQFASLLISSGVWFEGSTRSAAF